MLQLCNSRIARITSRVILNYTQKQTYIIHKISKHAHQLWRQGRCSQAIQFLQTANKTDDISLTEQTANMLMSSREYQRAIEYYNELLNKKISEKHKAELFAKLGKCFLHENYHEKAEEFFFEAKKVDPSVNIDQIRKTDPMEKRTIIVGDVHGCFDECKALLNKCQYNPAKDNLVFVGDMIGKGPKQKQMIEFAMKSNAQCVLGNHDDYVLSWHFSHLEDRKYLHELPPSHSQVEKQLTDAEWEWMKTWPLYITIPQYNIVVVHAGIVPGIELQEQSKDDLLTMRDILPNGKATSKRGEGEPWASKYEGPQLVVFGHDAVRGIQEHNFAIGLDSGCVYGNKLSALILPDYEIVSVESQQYYKPKI